MIRAVLIAGLALTALGCSVVLGLGDFDEAQEGKDGGGDGAAGAAGAGAPTQGSKPRKTSPWVVWS